jgi:hypothetical protein
MKHEHALWMLNLNGTYTDHSALTADVEGFTLPTPNSGVPVMYLSL